MPQARCVSNTHMPHGPLSAARRSAPGHGGTEALGFHDDIAYVDYQGLALDYAEGERLARALGDKSVLILRNHGVLVTARSAAQAFERLYFLERACQAQVLALSTGRKLRIFLIFRAGDCRQFRAGESVGGEERTSCTFRL